MKVICSIATLNEQSGGTATSVAELSRALTEAGVEVVLLSTDWVEGNTDKLIDINGVPRSTDANAIGIPLPRNLAIASRFLKSTIRELNAPKPDVWHDNGLWLPNNLIATVAANRLKVPLIVSARGMLMRGALQNSSIRKRVAWAMYQRQMLASAKAIHATSVQELDAISSLNLGIPIALIPNGIRLPSLVTRPRNSRNSPRKIIFLGRLHPIKNLNTLIEAWSLVRAENWTLEIIGTGSADYTQFLYKIAKERRVTDSVAILGERRGHQKWSSLANANVIVLPSLSENFGNAALEGLSTGLPLIATTGTPWSELQRLGCGWYVKPTVDGIAEGIRAATSLTDEERELMGHRARLFASKFEWHKVASQFIDLYRWARSGACEPSFLKI